MEEEWGGREREQRGKRRDGQTQRDRWTQRNMESERDADTCTHIAHTEKDLLIAVSLNQNIIF